MYTVNVYPIISMVMVKNRIKNKYNEPRIIIRKKITKIANQNNDFTNDGLHF